MLALSACKLGFDAEEGSTHYVSVSVASNKTDTVQFAISVDLQGCQLSEGSAGALLVNSINTSLLCGEPNLRPVKVLFQSYNTEEGRISQCGNMMSVLLARRRDRVGGSQFVRTGNVSVTTPVKLATDKVTVLQFTTDMSDTVGSLAVEVAILRSHSASRLSVSGCLSRGYRSLPVNGVCPHGRLLQQSTDHPPVSTVYEQVLVQYPSPGTWYLTLSSQCSDHASTCSVPVLFSVHTNQCFSGVCGRYGRCHAYLSSGTFYSSCQCFAGHRGPACNDPSGAVSDYQLLITSLLLTTSNLAMLPAIMLAAYRGHYTECIVFTAHLIASCLYHACVEDVYSVCVISLTILRWSDMFTTVLTIWVTIITMAQLSVIIRSVLNMTSVMVLSILCLYTTNITLTLVIPSVVSVVVLLLCWTISCVTTGQCSPRTRYCMLHCCPGLMLLSLSIIIATLYPDKG